MTSPSPSSSPSSPSRPLPSFPSPPTPPPPLSGPPVRRLVLDDLPACLALAEDRGWTREERKWRLLLTAGQGYGIDAPPGDPSPALPESGGNPRGSLIGTAVLTSYGPPPGVFGAGAAGCVSMVLVAERHARRGLGRRLVRHVLEESGDATVFLFATDLGRPLYEGLGFVPVAPVEMFTGAFACPCPVPCAGGTDGRTAGVTVRDATAADLPAVRTLDAAVFGADRTHLLTRLPSFADHFVVAAADDRLTGFAAAWPNGTTTVIGPVVAEDPPTARALIARLASRTGGPVRLDSYIRHREQAAWLRAHGLDGDFLCTLMVHGAPDASGAPGVPMDLDRCFAPYAVALG